MYYSNKKPIGTVTSPMGLTGLPLKVSSALIKRRREGDNGGEAYKSGYCSFLKFFKCPNFFWNFSTLPAESISFCLPVKNG